MNFTNQRGVQLLCPNSTVAPQYNLNLEELVIDERTKVLLW